MKKVQVILLMTAITWAVCTGCGKQETVGNVSVNDSTTQSEQEEVQSDITEQPQQDETKDESKSQVASKEEMADAIDVVDDSMTPVYGKDIKSGVYDITVKSSSPMFKIVSCSLQVEDGEMKATMTMSGTGYLKLFMGTGEEAATATEDSFIPFVENEQGEHTFTVPVEALNMGINCAAYSAKKEKWYDRVLVFCADSLPQDALEEGTIATVESLGLEDGNYTVDVTLEGGSGRASVESPAKLNIDGGTAYATIIFSSPNYDYMMVDGEKYLPINTEGNSTFEIPVSGFDWKMAVSADTTAMSTPHEIEYTLYFDSTTIHKEE